MTGTVGSDQPLLVRYLASESSAVPQTPPTAKTAIPLPRLETRVGEGKSMDSDQVSKKVSAGPSAGRTRKRSNSIPPTPSSTQFIVGNVSLLNLVEGLMILIFWTL